MTHPGCRSRSVKYKHTGFILHIMKAQSDIVRINVMSETRNMLAGFESDGKPVVGFALVMWGSDGASSATIISGEGSAIPAIAMPEFIKNRLIAAKIEEWCRS